MLQCTECQLSVSRCALPIIFLFRLLYFAKAHSLQCTECPGVALRQSGLNANVSRNLVFQPKTIKSVFEAVICRWTDTEDIKFESRCLSRVTTSPDCEACPQKAAATGRGFMGGTTLLVLVLTVTN